MIAKLSEREGDLRVVIRSTDGGFDYLHVVARNEVIATEAREGGGAGSGQHGPASEAAPFGPSEPVLVLEPG